MTKPENNFTTPDIVLLSVAALFIFFVIRICLYQLADPQTTGKDLLLLSSTVSFAIFLFQFKALRKQKVFLSWSFLACLMLIMFFWLHRDASLNYVDKDNLGTHNYASGLTVPFALLIIFFICRKISNKYYGTELLVPNRSFNQVDYVEKRKFNSIDYLWWGASLGIIIFGHFY